MLCRTGRRQWFKDASKRSQREAILWEEQARANLQEQATQPTPEAKPTPTIFLLSLLEWATRYMDDGKGRWAEKTYQEKRLVFRRFFRFHDPNTLVDGYEIGQASSTSPSSARSGVAML